MNKTKAIKRINFYDGVDLNTIPEVNIDYGTSLWHLKGDTTKLFTGHGFHKVGYMGPDEGMIVWCLNGRLHRLDGPALRHLNGGEFWYQNGQLHREDGAAATYADDQQEWYQNNLKHRVDGPAVIYADGDKEWYQNDRLHRLDGPAVMDADGTHEWYLNGEYITSEEVEEFMADGMVPGDYTEWTDKHKMTFKLRFCGVL